MLHHAPHLTFFSGEFEAVHSLERGLKRRLVALSDQPLVAVTLSVLGFAFLGPIAAVLIVATMLDHEFAHRFMMRKLGYNPGPVRIIPFIGAYVKAGRPLLRSSDIALIYLAGPLAGVLSAALAVVVSVQLLPAALLHQVYVGAMVAIALNLFNLIPLEPLDGGLVSRVLPYQCLVFFPTIIGLSLAVERQLLFPFGAPIFLVACWLTFRKLLKWRRYLAALRAREDAGDLHALREVRASLDVPLMERMLVVTGYGTLVGGASALLLLLAQAALWSA